MPGWTLPKDAILRAVSQGQDLQTAPGMNLEVKRVRKAGDKVEVTFPLEVRLSPLASMPISTWAVEPGAAAQQALIRDPEIWPAAERVAPVEALFVTTMASPRQY